MQDPAAEELRLPRASVDALRAAVEEAQRDRATLERHASAVREVVYRLDQGTLRVAEKDSGGWTIHGWIQQAINLFFGLSQSETYSAGVMSKSPQIWFPPPPGSRASAGAVTQYGSKFVGVTKVLSVAVKFCSQRFR